MHDGETKMITKAECVKIVTDAMAEFGRYSYYDKGADEVIDMDAVIKKTKDMNAEQIIKLVHDLKSFQHSEPFLQCLISGLEDRNDFDEIVDDKFISKYY